MKVDQGVERLFEAGRIVRPNDLNRNVVTYCDEVDSVFVIRFENEPDVVTYADDVDSLFVMRDANEDESVDTVDTCDISVPFNEIEPVNIGLCISIYYCFRINITADYNV